MAKDVASAKFGRDNDSEPILYIVRHGETELNASNAFRGFKDVEINTKGRQEAERARGFLDDVDFVAAYSSDLKRTIQTLDIILKGQKVTAQRLVALRPWNVGDFAGKPKTEANKKIVQGYADNPERAVPNGESLSLFRSRYENVFNDMLGRGGPALVVQHASNNHEIGNIVYGDIDAVDAEPGSVIGVWRVGKKLEAKILFGSEETSESYT